MSATSETDRSLWTLIVAPTIWAAHFLLSYVVAAVYCAKVLEPVTDLAPVRYWVAGLTIAALAVITATGIAANRRSGPGLLFELPHEEDTARDRRYFMGHSTMLLSGLSFVATLYVALPILFIETCR